MNFYPVLRPVLFAFPPEFAHRAVIYALKWGVLPKAGLPPENPALHMNLWGLDFPNPVGLAPGFDKNAEVIDGLLQQGFGFIEVGTCTPEPQEGNPKPRLFRLPEDEAIVNRLGFNNAGYKVFMRNLQGRKVAGIVGANIGKNKDTEKALDDYLFMLKRVLPYADYITVNISSPNTKGLRDLQEAKALKELLDPLIGEREAYMRTNGVKRPILLKIAPDMKEPQLADIAKVSLDLEIDGLVISNTTVSRPATLSSPLRKEKGGLSGRPLMPLSTEMLADAYRLTEGKIPLIGVGGISSGEDAYAKIRAGASLVQLYTGCVYQGFGVVQKINRSIERLLARDGFNTLAEAVGSSGKKHSGGRKKVV